MKGHSPSDIVTLMTLSVEDLTFSGEVSSTAISTLLCLLPEKNLLPTRLGFRLGLSWVVLLEDATVRSNSCVTSSIQNCKLSKRGLERVKTIEGISISAMRAAERLLLCPDGNGGFWDSLTKLNRLIGYASPRKRMWSCKAGTSLSVASDRGPIEQKPLAVSAPAGEHPNSKVRHSATSR
jgi:hypothetical protein